MTRSGRLFYLLMTIHFIGLMSQQVWGQHPLDNDPMALAYDFATTDTMVTTNDILLDDDNEQLITDADLLLEQDLDDDNNEDDADDEDDSTTIMSMDNYVGPLGQGDSKAQEQGDELGEELLVEYDDENDDDDDDDDGGDNNTHHDGLMFEDDEAPLDFKNDEQVDLDQLLFDASQKDDANTNIDYQDITTLNDNNSIDELLSNADEALRVDPLDETTDDAEHPDHDIQEQQQPPPNDLPPPSPPSSSNNNNMNGSAPLATENQSSHRYKLPLFGVLALLILLYKVSNKKQGGRIKCLEKEEKGLPLHTKDLKIPDIAVDCSILVESSQASPLGTTTTTQPSPTGHSHHQLGRRASSSSFFSPRQASNGTTTTTGGGHARKISLGHHPMVGSQSKYRQ